MKLPFTSKKIGGIIGYLNLDDFWLSLDKSEQEALVRYYRGGLGSDPNGSPIKGSVTYSTQTQLNYLDIALMWAVSEKNYTFADKLIERGEEAIQEGQYTLTNLHFFLQNAAECYYKQRSSRSDAIDKSIKYCVRDIQAFPKYSKELLKESPTLPRIVTFQRLAIIFENDKQYQKAIEVCDLALKYGLHDSTKGGYEARKAKLEKKLNG